MKTIDKISRARDAWDLLKHLDALEQAVAEYNNAPTTMIVENEIERTTFCSISCATNGELESMLKKASYTDYYRKLIAAEMIRRRLAKGE